MATVSNEEAERMSEEYKSDYCIWCWFKDYGNCDKCALKKNTKKRNI